VPVWDRDGTNTIVSLMVDTVEIAPEGQIPGPMKRLEKIIAEAARLNSTAPQQEMERS
jgi:hypothetical protein